MAPFLPSARRPDAETILPNEPLIPALAIDFQGVNVLVTSFGGHDDATAKLLELTPNA